MGMEEGGKKWHFGGRENRIIEVIWEMLVIQTQILSKMSLSESYGQSAPLEWWGSASPRVRQRIAPACQSTQQISRAN